MGRAVLAMPSPPMWGETNKVSGMAHPTKYSEAKPLILGDPDGSKPLLVVTTASTHGLRNNSELYVTGSEVEDYLDRGILAEVREASGGKAATKAAAPAKKAAKKAAKRAAKKSAKKG